MLIEVLLTIVILSSIIVVVIQSFLTSLRATRDSLAYSHAALLLDHTLTHLVLQRSVDSQYSARDAFPEPFTDYHYRIQAFPPSGWSIHSAGDEDEALRLNEVTVDIDWKQGRRKKTLSSTLYIPQTPDEDDDE